MCDIFDFDGEIECLPASADEYISTSGNCVQLRVDSSHIWLALPLSHGLSATTARKITTVSMLDLNESVCVLGGPSYVLGFKQGSSKLPIQFTTKHRCVYFLVTLQILFLFLFSY